MAGIDDVIGGGPPSRAGGDIQPGSRAGGDIQPGSRAGGDIQPGSRAGGDIQPGSRAGGDIQPGSRAGGDIQPGSRAGGDIQPGSRAGGDIQPGSRAGGDIQPGSRAGGDIQPGSRAGGDIQPGSRAGGDIQPGSRAGGDIQPGSRAGGDIQPGSRAGGDIQPGSRAGGDIQPGSRAGGDIQPGSRAGGDIQPGSRAGGDIQPQSRTESIVTHAEGSISEDAIVAGARERAVDIGAGAVTPAVGALLCVLAKLTGAKSVVEVGTGAGVSGLWLLSGMREDGVLTTIDVEPEHQRLAKQAFTEAGVGPSRTRLISGRAQEVLTRLADESYDLVFIDGDPIDQPQFVVEGVRLLRPGGAIVVHRAALGGRAGDANANDAEVSAVREAARLIAEDERLTPVLIPLGDGLLAAARD